MRRSLALVAIVAAFGIGVAVSNIVRAAISVFGGRITCIENNVCIGANAPAVFTSLDTDRFGLSALICLGEVKRDGTIIFLRDIIDGKRCPTANYIVELRNPVLRTTIEVRNGKIVDITKGPLHGIDL